MAKIVFQGFNDFDFQVGQWVVRGDTVAQILDVQEQYYIGIDINGKDFTSSRFLSNDKIHLWTIQDAKDGDVLMTNTNQPFIFNGCYDTDTDYLGGYCGICSLVKDDSFYVEEDSESPWCFNIGIKPATKEQRELLFTKMKEAGYEWDAEKKELKKIEPNLAEWSDEDEKAIGIIKLALEHPYDMDGKWDRQFALDWLKSLKPQNHWKPSEQQMVSIEHAVKYMKESPIYDSELVSLFNDLKKLKKD